MPVRVTALKYAAWKAAMQRPRATKRQRSARAMRKDRVDQRASASRSGAAISIRKAAITSGVAPASATSTVVTEPVVPQETAASPMRREAAQPGWA